MSVEGFVSALAAARAPAECANPYADVRAGIDARPDAPMVRAAQLSAYLSHRVGHARLALVAEAPGYQGSRFTGIAMTCERTLLGAKPGVPPDAVMDLRAVRTSDPGCARNGPERASGFSEPTASIVWRAVLARGAAREVVQWNTFPFHPHKPGCPLSNRTPTPAEVAAHIGHLRAFLALFGAARVVAVGETARRNLAQLGIAAQAVRHPANGGATKFRDGIAAALDAL